MTAFHGLGSEPVGKADQFVIDWKQPVYAIASDCRLASVFDVVANEHGSAKLKICESEDHVWHVHANGYVRESAWIIRNVETVLEQPAEASRDDIVTAPNTPAGYSDEVVERISRALRAYARNDPSLILTGNSIAAELYALADLLPEPVDPDEQYARDLIREQGWQGEREIGSEAVVRMIVMARRGRALAAEGK